MDTFWLVLRVVVSLAVVLGLIWALARVRKRVGPTGSDVVTVMSKIPVTKKGSVLLVKAGGLRPFCWERRTPKSLSWRQWNCQEEEEAKEERTRQAFRFAVDGSNRAIRLQRLRLPLWHRGEQRQIGFENDDSPSQAQYCHRAHGDS